MAGLWVVVADESIARILAAPPAGGDLEEVEQLTDAMARADRTELRRDAQGRRAGGGTLPAGTVTASAGEDQLHQEAELFARRVAQHLAEARHQQRFERLRLAAAPRFLGLLRKALDREVADCIESELDRDLVQLSRRELTLAALPAARRHSAVAVAESGSVASAGRPCRVNVPARPAAARHSPSARSAACLPARKAWSEL